MRRDEPFKRWERTQEAAMVETILNAVKRMQGPEEANEDTKINAYIFRTKRPRTKKSRKTIKEFAKIATWDEDIEAVEINGKCFYFR